MPLEFLRRRRGASRPADRAGSAAGGAHAAAPAIPEEIVAEDHQLRLTYAAKSSEGVRLPGEPDSIAQLASMLGSVAISPVEVIQPRARELEQAAPSIIRTEQALTWLRAYGDSSPITRHALFVLETLDALDPAYDTFACALLDGELDPAGYPEYASVVGGVAAHWDEATGDVIVRALVGWGGRGTRGDTDRTASRLLGALMGNILETGLALGVAPTDRPALVGSAAITCPHCGAAASARAVYCPTCGMRLVH